MWHGLQSVGFELPQRKHPQAEARATQFSQSAVDSVQPASLVRNACETPLAEVKSIGPVKYCATKTRHSNSSAFSSQFDRKCELVVIAVGVYIRAAGHLGIACKRQPRFLADRDCVLRPSILGRGLRLQCLGGLDGLHCLLLHTSLLQGTD